MREILTVISVAVIGTASIVLIKRALKKKAESTGYSSESYIIRSIPESFVEPKATSKEKIKPEADGFSGRESNWQYASYLPVQGRAASLAWSGADGSW